MKTVKTLRTLLSLAGVLAGVTLAFPAAAQNTPADPSNGNNSHVAAPPAAGPDAPGSAATMNNGSSTSTKAQRHAAHKQARAKNTAELKKLESTGYQPERNDPHYPNDIQSAQKKAGMGAAASQ